MYPLATILFFSLEFSLPCILIGKNNFFMRGYVYDATNFTYVNSIYISNELQG
jgi:hypothetical protein